MSATRILRNSGALLSHTFYADGAAIAADGTVTATIRKADGTTLVTGNATAVTGPPASYTFTLPPSADLNLLSVTWAGTFSGIAQSQVDVVEIVGDFWFSVAAARASDSALVDPTIYPNAAIIAARDEVEDEFEAITKVAWVRRFAREQLDGSWRRELALDHLYPRRVLSLTVDGYAYNSTELASLVPEDHGAIARANFATVATAVSPKNVTVEYEHGHDAPPHDLRRAALTRLRYRLTAAHSSIPDRATSYVPAGGGGNFTIATPGQRGSITGIPDVDTVLRRYTEYAGGIA